LNVPNGIAVSGSDLFVTNVGSGTPGSGTIGEYTTSGATVNASLISGLYIPEGIAVVVPEPSTGALLAAGIVGLSVRRHRARGASLERRLPPSCHDAERNPHGTGAALSKSTLGRYRSER